jgi:hypothetical protein
LTIAVNTTEPGTRFEEALNLGERRRALMPEGFCRYLDQGVSQWTSTFAFLRRAADASIPL